MPDEITHRGDVALRFVARPVRVEQLNGGGGFHQRVQGVAARLDTPATEEKPEAEDTFERTKRAK